MGNLPVQHTRLKDISKLIGSGITPRRDNPEFWENGTIPWLKTEQLDAHKIYETTEKITEIALKKTSIKLFPINTLSIAMYGEGKTRGNVAILKRPMTTNQACCNVVLNAEQADYEYVYYYLKTQYAQLRALSSGVRKNLNANDIKEYVIRLPATISAQKRIAAVLSSLDAKIELNNRINAELEAMAKTLYDYWFVQFDFPNAKGKPYKSSGGKMVYNAELKREIPEGWEAVKLSDCVDLEKSGDWGKGESVGNYVTEVMCLRGTDLRSLSGLDTSEPPIRFILRKNEHKILKPHEVIIEISGGSPAQSTGRLGVLTEAAIKRFNLPVICSNFCKPASMKNQKFLFNFAHAWNSLYDSGVFFDYEGKTTGIKNLLLDRLLDSFYLALPPDSILSKFYEIMTNIDEKKQTALRENRSLASLRDWLLPMLMNGQVTVG